ncbi:MAG: hypothetical protein DRN60_01525 [Thaumarchaeota archaeon]|nr:MAG: hypothetical protein DRN60_01525 [Nitrososphaerota archaeon]
MTLGGKTYLYATPTLHGMGEFWEGVLWGMGFEEEKPRKRCKFCRRLIPADAKYCPYCGKRLK